MTKHERVCNECGNRAEHTSDVAPDVICTSCGSYDTRPVHSRITRENHMMRWFTYNHLPDKLQGVSWLFAELAQRLVDEIAAGPELDNALRKLLESKDSAVRAKIEEST